jgi:MFS family permease
MNTATLPTRDCDENSLRYPGWRVTAAASACVFVSFASLLVYTFGVFLKPLAKEFGWSREQVSGAFGLAALSLAAASPLLGYLLDRYPARRIIVPCLAIFGCAFASLSLMTPHLWHLYSVFIVIGIVGNGGAHLAYGRTLTTWFQARRGVAFSILLTGGALGAMVLPAVAEWLIRALGWRGAFVVLGAMVIVVGVPLGTQIRERSSPDSSAVGDGARGFSAAKALRSPSFWIIVAVLFLISISQNGAIAHLAALLTDRGVSPVNAAFAVSALGGAALLGRLGTGALLDRFFAPYVSFGLLSLAALGTFILSGAKSLPAGILGAALIGFGMGGEADVTPYLLSKYFGLKAFSLLYGITWTFYSIAGGIGPVIMGKAFDATGSYATLLRWLSLLTLCAAALMLLLPRYQSSHGQHEAILPEFQAGSAQDPQEASIQG